MSALVPCPDSCYCGCSTCEGAILEVVFAGWTSNDTFSFTWLGVSVGGSNFEPADAEVTRAAIELLFRGFGLATSDTDPTGDYQVEVVSTGPASGGDQTFEIRFHCELCFVNWQAADFGWARTSGVAGTITDSIIQAPATPFDEVQRIALGGGNGTFTIEWDGVSASAPLTKNNASALPTIAQVQASLETIGALTGNTFVFGGGSFTHAVVFVNGMAGVDQPFGSPDGFTFTINTGTTTATINAVADGG